jgi:hypothetical protein
MAIMIPQNMLDDIFENTKSSDKWVKVKCTDGRELYVRGIFFSYVDYPDEEDVEALGCEVKNGKCEMITERMLESVELPAVDLT